MGDQIVESNREPCQLSIGIIIFNNCVRIFQWQTIGVEIWKEERFIRTLQCGIEVFRPYGIKIIKYFPPIGHCPAGMRVRDRGWASAIPAPSGPKKTLLEIVV